MAENIKTFEMLIDDELVDGVYAISLVDSPAIETDYIMLSKNGKDYIEIKLEKGDEKRKVVTGPALIPDKVIPRKGYNIVFSSDTIRKISENFMIQNKKDNVKDMCLKDHHCSYIDNVCKLYIQKDGYYKNDLLNYLIKK